MRIKYGATCRPKLPTVGSRPLVVYGVRSEIPMNPITVLLQSYNALLSRVKVVHAAADVAW